MGFLKNKMFFLQAFFLIVFFLNVPLVFGVSVGPTESGKDSVDTPIRNFQDKIRSFEDQFINRGIGANKGDHISGGGVGSDMGQIYYSVHVLGEVANPGPYKVLPSDRVTDALAYAGGVLGHGSTRTVQLRRYNSNRVLDLHAYKYYGWLNQNPYLVENDIIYVPMKKGEIQIEGAVNRPGNYEIVSSINLEKAVSLAGDFSEGRSLQQPIRVVRFSEDEEKEIIQIENSEKELRSFIVKKGDVIVVPHMLLADKTFDFNVKRIPGDNIFYPTINDNVYVIGAVTNPGPYQFQPSFSHNDYVSLAGPNETASLRRVKVITSDGKKKYIKRGYEVNPGDTIVVPTKSVSTANILAWFNTITSSTLTSLLIYNQVK